MHRLLVRFRDGGGRAVVVATVVCLAAAAAGCDRGGAGGIREPSAEALEAQRVSVELSTARAAALARSPDSAGRIIYDPPVDLSYENALATRPDLVRPDTSRVRGVLPGGAPRPSRLQDTTAGDAAADTSGGRARRRPPR
jgi:hypothetical protein